MTNSAWMGEQAWLGGGRGIPPWVLGLKESGLAFMLPWRVRPQRGEVQGYGEKPRQHPFGDVKDTSTAGCGQ